MFDTFRLKEALVKYKQVFVSKQWKAEKYKWVAIKVFQDNWDIRARDFAEMLSKSLSKTSNLLASRDNYPKEAIIKFAGIAPEEVRAMFVALFDENRDVVDRVLEFKDKSSILLEKYGNGDKQHYQYENAITTYLWLRYPDKYYIFRLGILKTAADELGSDYRFKKGAYEENLRQCFAFYNEVCEYIKTDAELTELFKSQLTPDCYPDPEYRTLATDVCFYLTRRPSTPTPPRPEEWFPTDYSPEISTATWAKLLHNSKVFTTESLEIMKRMKDYGGQATCSQLASKYGEEKNFYSAGSVALARRVADATGCPIYRGDDERTKWWPILYVGKDADKDDKGSYIWKLREELATALKSVDLSDVNLQTNSCRYWWLNANPKIWSLANMAVGATQSYTLYNENGNKRMIFQNFLDVKAGDLVIGYESNPVKQIVALCKITAGSDGEKILFEKLEGLPSPISYEDLKSYPEFEETEFYKIRTGSLFKLTKDQYDFIVDRIREENAPVEPKQEQKLNEYSKARFLDEVYLSEEQYDTLITLLKNKQNIILKGAPGVGKTYAARRLAYAMMGEEDDSRIEYVQFHQNYSYENFMMGYRPDGSDFKLSYGIFYRFCQKAANLPDKDFFFIIDEINRGNMSKIFGELLMMIEKDYRGTKTTLAYDGMPFSVPKNLYIIGMMNTADRSLAMIDYALRRRFGFSTFEPQFDSDGFKKYQKGLNSETFNTLIDQIKELNEAIKKDKALGKGFVIGHSYFCNWKECTKEKVLSVVNNDIIPMLEEYWYDDDKTLQKWSERLQKVVQ